ncbi:MAG: right-handed parallel beta-helix repeat-containing protein, partial [Akkermansiaceae bacterium]|nr:right-handed parallel beta-helix repeat-containing protein [Akkermansiaceae bacterium]
LKSMMILALAAVTLRADVVEVDSIAALAAAARGSDGEIRMKPGTYRMADYLTDEVLAEITAAVDRTQPRPPVPMLVLRGDGNRIDLTGVTIEIDNALFARLPKGGYIRCIIVVGKGNHIHGLVLKNTGQNEGSGGNLISIQGDDNKLEDMSLHVSGSFPWGYGDLLGKGGPNLVSLRKQSGIQVIGNRSVLRRCRVVSRAFGHCFYIQGGDGILLEDCHAEGSMRPTDEMLAETEGPAFEQGFRSVYRNRDGRFMIAPGYIKSLSEDGFRTYSNAGQVTLKGCTAVNTRAGFEIGARDDATTKTVLESCTARGCERGFLIGSHTVVRNCEGDMVHGPLLYLRGGLGSDVEIKLVGGKPEGLVHAVATIAGQDHRVRLIDGTDGAVMPALPVMVGYGMPMHAEMASPIEEAEARRIQFHSGLRFAPLLVSGKIEDCEISGEGRRWNDEDLRKDPGPWDLPPNGIAPGTPGKLR